jgi:hypothetical protein
MLPTLIAAALATMLGQGPPRGVAVAGSVRDQTGAVLPGAEIALVDPSGRVVRTIATDAAGGFRFDGVAPGSYDLHTAFPGFKPNVAHVRVGNRALGATTIVMQIEGVTQDVSVTSGGGANASAAANLDTIAVDGVEVNALSVSASAVQQIKINQDESERRRSAINVARRLQPSVRCVGVRRSLG